MIETTRNNEGREVRCKEGASKSGYNINLFRKVIPIDDPSDTAMFDILTDFYDN